MTRTNELFHVSFPICPRNPLKYELINAVCGRKVEPRSNWEKRDPKTGTLISSIVPRPVQIIRLSRFLSPFSFLFTLKPSNSIHDNLWSIPSFAQTQSRLECHNVLICFSVVEMTKSLRVRETAPWHLVFHYLYSSLSFWGARELGIHFSKAILQGSSPIYHKIKQCLRRIDNWSHFTTWVASQCIFRRSGCLWEIDWIIDRKVVIWVDRERQWYQLHNRQSCQITPRPERALKATKGRLSEKEERRLVV